MEVDEARAVVCGVDGWLTDREGELLYHLARKCTGRGTIVEIGSWKGRSTIWLAAGSKAGSHAKVYAVDPHTGSSELISRYGPIWTFEEFKSNIRRAKVDDVVVPLVTTSAQAARDFRGPVELIFVDGAHEYELVRLDFELWFPQVIDGGIMAFHDSTGRWLGPTRVVEERVYKSRAFRNVRVVDRITVAEKVAINSVAERFRNYSALLLKRASRFTATGYTPASRGGFPFCPAGRGS